MSGICSWCSSDTMVLSAVSLCTHLGCTYYRPEVTELCEYGALKLVMSLKSKHLC